MIIRAREGKNVRTILLLRSYWDRDQKKSAQNMVASFPGNSEKLPDDLSGPDSPLSEQEKIEVQTWLDNSGLQERANKLPTLGAQIAQQSDTLADALENPGLSEFALDGLDHVALYGSIDRLTKVLRKHNLARPSRKSTSD